MNDWTYTTSSNATYTGSISMGTFTIDTIRFDDPPDIAVPARPTPRPPTLPGAMSLVLPS